MALPFNALASGINQLFEFVKGIPEKIINGFKDLFSFLFIPSEGYFDRKLEVIKEKFIFIDNVKQTVQVFTNFFSNDFEESPSITVNLSSAKSKYNYGNNAKISFEWFEPYRSSVHTILSSFIWVVFVWGVYKHLPSIINGVNSGSAASSATKGGNE